MEIPSKFHLASVATQKGKILLHGGYNLIMDEFKGCSIEKFVETCKNVAMKLNIHADWSDKRKSEELVKKCEDLVFARFCDNKVKSQYSLDNKLSLFGKNVLWNLDRLTNEHSTIHFETTYHSQRVSDS